MNQPIVVYAMPVETTIDDPAVSGDHYSGRLSNVVKDMLPKGGEPYALNWTRGMSENFTVSWDLNKLAESNVIYDNSKLGIIVFIQNDVNEGSREVYQSGFATLPALQKTIITGLDDELNVNKFKNAVIYPNPAQNYFNVTLSDQLTTDLDWAIVDQRGVKLQSGTFISGEDFFEVDVKELPNGLHMFVVSSGDHNKAIRKIIIQR